MIIYVLCCLESVVPENWREFTQVFHFQTEVHLTVTALRFLGDRL